MRLLVYFHVVSVGKKEGWEQDDPYEIDLSDQATALEAFEQTLKRQFVEPRKLKRVELGNGQEPLVITDPDTEVKYPQEPSYFVSGCLLTIRNWFSYFGGPRLSVILVGSESDASTLIQELGASLQEAWSAALKAIKHRYDVKNRTSRDLYEVPDNLAFPGQHAYAELFVERLRGRNYFVSAL